MENEIRLEDLGMKRIMAVYDVDPFYADRFAEFVNRKETVPFTAVALPVSGG